MLSLLITKAGKFPHLHQAASKSGCATWRKCGGGRLWFIPDFREIPLFFLAVYPITAASATRFTITDLQKTFFYTQNPAQSSNYVFTFTVLCNRTPVLNWPSRWKEQSTKTPHCLNAGKLVLLYFIIYSMARARDSSRQLFRAGTTLCSGEAFNSPNWLFGQTGETRLVSILLNIGLWKYQLKVIPHIVTNTSPSWNSHSLRPCAFCIHHQPVVRSGYPWGRVTAMLSKTSYPRNRANFSH